MIGAASKWLVLMYVIDEPELEELVEVEAKDRLDAMAHARMTRNMPSSWGIKEVCEA